MSGCEMLKCKYFSIKSRRCNCPYDYVNKNTGEDMCYLNTDAIPRNEYEMLKDSLLFVKHEVSYL